MVEATLWFGRETIRARFPERTYVVGARQPGEGIRRQTRDERLAAVRNALLQPLDRPRLRDLVRPGASVVIAFDDPTVRGSGDVRELIIEACLEELAAAGVDERNVRLICANALHRKFTHEELAHVIGRALADRFADRLECHDAEDWDNIVSYGRTPGGHWVDLNRAAAEADLLVYVNAGCVLGFSGGWKSVVVGLSTWRSIKSTHHPDGMSMSIAHNRMHAVFEEMAAQLPEGLQRRIFKVETVMDGAEAVAGVWAGSIPATRAAALAFLATRNPPRRAAAPAKVDVVAYGVADASPYAVFARPNPILTLISSGLGYQGGYIEALGKPGCTVIMAAPVRDEWDTEHHPSYPEVWRKVLSETRDAYEIDRRYAEAFAQRADYIERYRFGVAFHPVHGILATQPLKRLRHAGRVIVAGAVDPDVPRYLGFDTADSVEDAVAMAQRIHGEECTFAVIGPAGDATLAPRSERLRP
jgi:lactate racemase